eukprot:TRINITY_DN6284_c0_g1_i2.p1 TRINITY_DN6284_c0_g1~~TRINITY_DN6284_c0_g1_i2.p1  ORF type:complete len:238 (+),score=9.76 TRINITY_DN6284_c0_g1_i2:839-1552(+)
MDLLDFQKLKRSNSGYAWILIAVDVFTRYAYAIPIKRKTKSETREGIVKLLDKLPKNHPLPKRFMSDNGPEFLNNEVSSLFDLYNIEHDTNEIGDHSALGIIDRFSRTVRERLEKHFAINKTSNWVVSLDKLIKAYNKTPHTTLHGRTPDSIEKNDMEILKDNLKKNYSVEQTRLKVGDQVRKALTRNVFSKGTKQRYSKETFTIERLKQVNAVLSDGSTERLENLIKVKDIEIVLD